MITAFNHPNPAIGMIPYNQSVYPKCRHLARDAATLINFWVASGNVAYFFLNFPINPVNVSAGGTRNATMTVNTTVRSAIRHSHA